MRRIQEIMDRVQQIGLQTLEHSHTNAAAADGQLGELRRLVTSSQTLTRSAERLAALAAQFRVIDDVEPEADGPPLEPSDVPARRRTTPIAAAGAGGAQGEQRARRLPGVERANPAILLGAECLLLALRAAAGADGTRGRPAHGGARGQPGRRQLVFADGSRRHVAGDLRRLSG